MKDQNLDQWGKDMTQAGLSCMMLLILVPICLLFLIFIWAFLTS